MRRWQTIVLFAILAGLTFQGSRMLLGLWTIEVWKQGVKAGISACPKAENYDTIMPSGADKVIDFGISKTIRE